jgi:hypothetical protein
MSAIQSFFFKIEAHFKTYDDAFQSCCNDKIISFVSIGSSRSLSAHCALNPDPVIEPKQSC